MSVENIIKEVTSELERMVTTKTVIGEPVETNGKTIIPVTKVTFGFGSGGGEGKSDKGETGFGGGGGAGAKIEPVAFIVISEDETRLLTISGKTDLGKIIESVPGVIDKLISVKNKMGKKDDIIEVIEEVEHEEADE
ncbi:MAG: spore germination protein GerW family protein [Methanosarcinaceae archaeon]|nr:sporulation protein [Methanosarcinaceae archaeon]MDF1532943.1 spore germination protein GerW family protein [Methanosarcinaceae archaeon]